VKTTRFAGGGERFFKKLPHLHLWSSDDDPTVVIQVCIFPRKGWFAWDTFPFCWASRHIVASLMCGRAGACTELLCFASSLSSQQFIRALQPRLYSRVQSH
jgi:hypothetical protein